MRRTPCDHAVLEVEIGYRDEGVAIGTCGCVVLFAWRGDATIERVRAADAILRAHAEAHTAVALLNVIEDGAEPPRGEAARTVVATLDELFPRVVGAAMIFEEGSSWMAMALDAVAALLGVLRKRVAQKHAVSREEACVWVRRRCEAAGEPKVPARGELLRALAFLQSALIEP